MSRLVCEKCNNSISDDSKFCPICGTAQNKQEIINPNINNVSTEDEKILESASSFNWQPILVFLVLISIIISMVSIYQNNIQKEAISLLSEGIIYNTKEVELLNERLYIEEGVVTDKVIIKKALLYTDSLDTYTLMGRIDIRPQPKYEKYFLGEGKFSLSKANTILMVEEIIDSLETFLVGSDFSLNSIIISAYNYSFAEYKNGKVTLLNK